jgi:hypothetical protein
VLTKISPEGGMLVNKISREGPYLVKTDNRPTSMDGGRTGQCSKRRT